MDVYEKIKQNPANVSPKQLEQLLQGYGFEWKRTTGDHKMYCRPGYRTFPIPINQDPLATHIVKKALAVIDAIREGEE